MYILNVRSHYDSAHFLRDYHGKCERLHGHRYEVEAGLAFEDVGAGGMAYDFTEVKRRLREIARQDLLPRLSEGGVAVDLLVRARREAYDAEFEELRRELMEWIERRWFAAR